MKKYYDDIIRRSDAIVKELGCKTVSQALEKLKKEEMISHAKQRQEKNNLF